MRSEGLAPKEVGMTERHYYEYYVSRATSCRRLAERASDPSIAAIHIDLATRYDRLAAEHSSNNTDPRPALLGDVT
jgi:hypothetical protein